MKLNSIRIKITFSALAVIFFSFLLSHLAIYLKSYGVLKHQILKDEDIVLSKVAENINYTLLDIKAIAYNITIDSEIEGYLRKSTQTGSFESYRDSVIIKQKLKLYKSLGNKIDSISIIKQNGDISSTSSNGDYLVVLSNETNSKENFDGFYEMITLSSINKNKLFNIVNYNKKIYDSNSYKSILGNLVIGMSYDSIVNAFDTLDLEYTKYYLITKSGEIIYSTDNLLSKFPDEVLNMINDQGSETTSFETKDSFIVINKNLENGWILAEYISKNKVYNKIWSGLLFIIVFGIIVMIIASIIITTRMLTITNSIKKLRDAMKQVSSGNLKTSINIKSNDEIEELTQVFNSMILNINNLIDAVSIEEKKRKNYEMITLLTQINPHFIYNTLGSVIYLARKNKTKDIIDLIVSLIRMMQRTISYNEEFVRLKEELEYINDYITIQKIRYGDIFSLIVKIDEDFNEYQIPRMILQPLVENCIFHGILPKGEHGVITIEVSKHNNKLIFSICDDGIGMEECLLKSILEEHTRIRGSDKYVNIGLKNITNRLKLLYGDNCGFEIKSEIGKGTTAEFVVLIE